MCKLEKHHSARRRAVVDRGYIAMLAVHKNFRKRKIGDVTQQLGEARVVVCVFFVFY